MRYLEVGLIDPKVVVEQDIYIYDPVVIHAIGRLGHTAQDALYLLGSGQQLTWAERSRHAYAGIEEAVGRREAPGFGLIKN